MKIHVSSIDIKCLHHTNCWKPKYTLDSRRSSCNSEFSCRSTFMSLFNCSISWNHRLIKKIKADLSFRYNVCMFLTIMLHYKILSVTCLCWCWTIWPSTLALSFTSSKSLIFIFRACKFEFASLLATASWWDNSPNDTPNSCTSSSSSWIRCTLSAAHDAIM